MRWTRRPWPARPRAALVVFVGVLLASATAGQQERVAESAGERVELSDSEKERFLRTAEILEVSDLSIGVTGSRRATLSDGRLTHHAHVQTVDIFLEKFTAGPTPELNFRDYWGYNVAAYRLDRLLDLNMVPVTVERRVEGEAASVSWWLDDVEMDFVEYRKGTRKPPQLTRFEDQRRMSWAFQQLVLNRDPNDGNHLIDKNWKLWLIDFTRAFRPWKKLDDVRALTRVPRRFYENLRDLDPAAVERELSPYVKKKELKGLFARRDNLIEHFEKRIRKHGESVVLVDWPVD